MTRKIAFWTVARPMSCGVRMNLRTVRPATATALGQNLAPELTRPLAGLSGESVITDASAMPFPFSSGGLMAARLAGGAARLAGQGEEDLIERGAPQRDVLDSGAAMVQGPHGLHQPARPVVDRDPHPASRAVDLGVTPDVR